MRVLGAILIVCSLHGCGKKDVAITWDNADPVILAYFDRSEAMRNVLLVGDEQLRSLGAKPKSEDLRSLSKRVTMHIEFAQPAPQVGELPGRASIIKQSDDQIDMMLEKSDRTKVRVRLTKVPSGFRPPSPQASVEGVWRFTASETDAGTTVSVVEWVDLAPYAPIEKAVREAGEKIRIEYLKKNSKRQRDMRHLERPEHSPLAAARASQP